MWFVAVRVHNRHLQQCQLCVQLHACQKPYMPAANYAAAQLVQQWCTGSTTCRGIFDMTMN
jgi:hypothetical protein